MPPCEVNSKGLALCHLALQGGSGTDSLLSLQTRWGWQLPHQDGSALLCTAPQEADPLRSAPEQGNPATCQLRVTARVPRGTSLLALGKGCGHTRLLGDVLEGVQGCCEAAGVLTSLFETAWKARHPMRNTLGNKGLEQLSYSLAFLTHFAKACVGIP
eukprot:6455143-Amphidinium_carterae.1